MDFDFTSPFFNTSGSFATKLHRHVTKKKERKQFEVNHVVSKNLKSN